MTRGRRLMTGLLLLPALLLGTLPGAGAGPDLPAGAPVYRLGPGALLGQDSGAVLDLSQHGHFRKLQTHKPLSITCK
jgi:hypothetical protein